MNYDDLQLQPNRWTCGPAALRNALLKYGERHNVRKIMRLAKATPLGTDEGQLARAAEALGYGLGHEWFAQEETAKCYVRLASSPLLTCVDTWTHWVVVLRADGRHVTIADSARPGPVLRRLTWREFFRRLASWTDGVRFDFYPLVRR